MIVSLILGHPHKGSFNHSIADAVIQALRNNSHEILFHDLYEEGFDPVLPYEEIHKDARLSGSIKTHSDEIAAADGIVIIHPNWWGQPPAIIKGWVDRVLRLGVAYEFIEGDSGEGVPKGLLKAKVALVFNTSNTPQGREQKVFGDPLETIWKNCILGLCGVSNVYRRTFNVIVTSTLKQREEWLREARETVDKYFPVNSVR